MGVPERPIAIPQVYVWSSPTSNRYGLAKGTGLRLHTSSQTRPDDTWFM